MPDMHEFTGPGNWEQAEIARSGSGRDSGANILASEPNKHMWIGFAGSFFFTINGTRARWRKPK